MKKEDLGMDIYTCYNEYDELIAPPCKCGTIGLGTGLFLSCYKLQQK